MLDVEVAEVLEALLNPRDRKPDVESAGDSEGCSA